MKNWEVAFNNPHLRVGYQYYLVCVNELLQLRDFSSLMQLSQLFAEKNYDPRIKYAHGSLLAYFKSFTLGANYLSKLRSFETGKIKHNLEIFSNYETHYKTKRLWDRFHSKFCAGIAESHAFSRGLSDTVCLAAADLIYYQKYGPEFESSILRTCPGANIVLGVSCTEDDFHSIKIQRQGLSTDSTETVRLPTHEELGLHDQVSKSAYYSCLRYLLLRALREKGLLITRRVIVLDIDLVMIRDPQNFLPIDSKADVALTLYHGNVINIMSLISGSCLMVRTSDGGLQFLDQVSNRILNVFARDYSSWHLDQVSLASAYLTVDESTIISLMPDTLVRSAPFSNIPYLNSTEAYFHSYTASITFKQDFKGV